MRVLYFVFSFVMIFAFELSAQKQANWWYFGNKAGLDFNTMSTATHPIPMGMANGGMNTTEGCAAISDVNGNLLFYTDGIRVWDSRHIVMPNGSGLMGDTVYVAQQPRVNGGIFPDTVVCRKQLVYNLKKLPYAIEWQVGSNRKRYTIDNEGDFSITMTDEFGCTGTEYFSVKECSGELYAPTGFTPNNKAIKEGFRVYKTKIYDFKITIVNRWNQVVFESNDITREWYGTNQKNGTECPIGVYLWKVSFKEIQNDQEQVVIGEVNIIR